MEKTKLKPFSAENFRKTLKAYSEYAELPVDCVNALGQALEMIIQSEEQLKCWCMQIDEYYKNYDLNLDEVFGKLDNIGKEINISQYTLYSLYLIMLTPHLAELYEERQYPYEVYLSSILDVKWKLIECKKVKGIWGSFVAWWTFGVFRLNIFGMGRLQFNPWELGVSYNDGKFVANKGDIVLETHIPSSGPLTREEYMKSFERAEKFFTRFKPECVRENYVVFCCISWLITPQNHEILPETSRVRDFADNFKIVEYNPDKDNNDLWRLFDVEKLPVNPEDLPSDGSLRRAYIEWFKKGNCMGEGYSVMFYKNGKIL